MSKKVVACVCCFFQGVQCPKHYTGFNYLKSALEIMLKLECLHGNIQKTVYIPIAEQYNTDIANVERCLRTLVNKWWEQCRCGGLFEKKPTNKELLANMADKLRGDLVTEYFA